MAVPLASKRRADMLGRRRLMLSVQTTMNSPLARMRHGRGLLLAAVTEVFT